MHTLLILNALKNSKVNYRPLRRDRLGGVIQKHGGHRDGGWHACDWYWETPRIGMMFQDNGIMNGHSTLGWILQCSDGGQTHCCKYLPILLRSIWSPMKTKNPMRHSCNSMKVINARCLVQLLITSRCYFVRWQVKFTIWSGGSQSVLRMILIFSTCMQKWAMMSVQKCTSNSEICQIPLCL